jgi:nanoRNase/pAp phosphatase (c-di-AMP/oligoRNAs hydrolase)
MQFGGGGHKKAAGFSMKGNLEEVRVAALKAVEAAISEARKRTA